MPGAFRYMIEHMGRAMAELDNLAANFPANTVRFKTWEAKAAACQRRGLKLKSTFGRDLRWINKSALRAVSLIRDQYANMFPAQAHLANLVLILDAGAAYFPTSNTPYETLTLYFEDAIDGLVRHYGQEGALGFPWSQAEAKKQLQLFLRWCVIIYIMLLLDCTCCACYLHHHHHLIARTVFCGRHCFNWIVRFG